MSDPTVTPTGTSAQHSSGQTTRSTTGRQTPTEARQDVREEWAARLQCADVGVDFPWLTDDGFDVWHEQAEAAQEHYRRLLDLALSAGLQIPAPSPAVSAPDLDAIRARAEGGTEGAWTVDRQTGQIWANPGEPVLVAQVGWAEDAEFIAHAREDVPALLAALAAAHAETERLRWEMRADEQANARLRELLDEARAALAALEAQVAAGEASDGHHTHRELYDYRMLYNAHAACGWLAAGIPVVKSLHHSDGEPCFGGGWFIVVATLPTGQVSNHYRTERWDLFDVPVVDLPPEYDGHTPADAADRLRAALAAAPSETKEGR